MRGLSRLICLHTATSLIIGLALAAHSPAHAVPIDSDSPWNGDWQIDLSRSSAVAKSDAPKVYRFKVKAGGTIRWEIPELGELLEGRTDGTPMAIRRKGVTPGLTLSVTAAGPRVLNYQVARYGKAVGGGQMILVDDGTAWVDLTWGPAGPGTGYELIYVKVKNRS